jgi:two-component system, OmpR family, response regulator
VTLQTHIAVLDDEVEITRLLATYLQAQGFRITQLHRGETLLDLMRSDPPALVLLDLGLPGEDGFGIARQLREHWRCGLVIVSGRGDAVDKVVGLEVGADDYVTKPFDLRELLARVKAVLRRLPERAAAAEAPAVRRLVAGPARPPAERCPGPGRGLDRRRIRSAQHLCAPPRPGAVARLPARSHARP